MDVKAFCSNHKCLVIGTLGFAVLGYIGYKTVGWVLKKIGIIKKTDDVAQGILEKQKSGRSFTTKGSNAYTETSPAQGSGKRKESKTTTDSQSGKVPATTGLNEFNNLMKGVNKSGSNQDSSAQPKPSIPTHTDFSELTARNKKETEERIKARREQYLQKTEATSNSSRPSTISNPKKSEQYVKTSEVIETVAETNSIVTPNKDLEEKLREHSFDQLSLPEMKALVKTPDFKNFFYRSYENFNSKDFKYLFVSSRFVKFVANILPHLSDDTVLAMELEKLSYKKFNTLFQLSSKIRKNEKTLNFLISRKKLTLDSSLVMFSNDLYKVLKV